MTTHWWLLLGLVWALGFLITFVKVMRSGFIDESVWDSIRNGGGGLGGLLFLMAVVTATLWPILVLPGLILTGLGNLLAIPGPRRGMVRRPRRLRR